MKRILKSALIFLPFVLTIIGVNIYADPANVLNAGYEAQVAEILVSGMNAGNLLNMDDRAFMREYASRRQEPVDILALGSSHVMQVTKELTENDGLFGAGVTGADLRDCISIYRLFKKEGHIPKRVLLSVDYWYFSENKLESRAMTDGYAEFCRDYGLRPIEATGKDRLLQKLNKKKEALSIPYFQQSLKYLLKENTQERQPYITQEHKTITAMRRSDGSHCYEEEYREAPQDVVNLRAFNVALASFGADFGNISRDLVEQYEAFLREMRNDGVEVAVFFAPYHPIYYDYMVSNPDEFKNVLDTEWIAGDIARENGATVFGSYNPYNLGLTESDFYDGLHCKEEAMYRFYPEGLFKAK